MNNLMISLLTLLFFLFHLYLRRHIRWGKVKEGLCALWCMDAVFAVCGMILSFALYHYSFAPFFTFRNILLGTAYLLLTFLFLLLSPSGISLLFPKKQTDSETLLAAEYRFNDTLCFIRSFFMVLLFVLPIFLNLPIKEERLLTLLLTWESKDVFGGFYFASFTILLPICLRQAFYFLKSLRYEASPSETALLRRYSMQLHYRRKNHFL